MTNKKITLVDTDQTRLNQILQQISGQAKAKQSLNKLLNQWELFVWEVERGYNDTIYDYANNLSSRDFLETILNSLSEDGRNEILRFLQPLDTILRNFTLPGKQPFSTIEIPKEKWWWHRIPINPSEELRKDLEEITTQT